MKTDLVKICLVKEATLNYSARITSAEQAAQVVRSLTKDDADEHFYVLSFDVKNRLVNVYEAAKGGSASLQFVPKDIFRSAVLSNASGIIVAHNHPSGDVTPSDVDIEHSKIIKKGCQLLGIRFLDALVVTDKEHRQIIKP